MTTHPHLEPSLKKELSYTSPPLWTFVACSRVNFALLNDKLAKMLYGMLPNNNKEKCLTPTRKPIIGKNCPPEKKPISQKNAKLNKQQTTNHQRRQDNALKLIP